MALEGGKVTKRFAAPVFLLAAVLSIPSVCFGTAAEVLPKAIWRATANYTTMLPTDQRFDPDGNTQNPAIYFNGNLNSQVFPGLGLVEQGFGMPAGSGTIGTSVVSFEYSSQSLNMALEYGVTDRLQVGLYIPYIWAENKVDAQLNTANATIGKNAAINTLAPLAVPGTVPLTAQDAKNLLSSGLQVGSTFIPGLGFKPFDTWKGNGFGDFDLGARYQFVKTVNWRAAAGLGLKFPTGKEDDPDNLVDWALGNGAYAPLFRLSTDYTGIKDLVLNATVKYDWYLPSTQTKRVPNSVTAPITTNPKVEVDLDIGDVFRVETGVEYYFTKEWKASVTYQYGAKQKDGASGPAGFNFNAIEERTDWTEHVLGGGVSYDTSQLFLQKKFPLPFQISLGYSNRFAGTNYSLKAQYLSVGLQIYF